MNTIWTRSNDVQVIELHVCELSALRNAILLIVKYCQKRNTCQILYETTLIASRLFRYLYIVFFIASIDIDA
jgi:tRNA isopentenyl-2-thiomethyl-A-37 hydroxylase MiaE